MIPFAAFALSLATLGFELAISRWLAIAHWDHNPALCENCVMQLRPS